MQSIGQRWMGRHLGVMSSAISFMLGRPGSTEVITQPTYRYKCIIMIRMEMLDKTASQMHVAQRIVWPTMWNGWRGNGCHILPLTGLNAFVYTGLNAQKLYISGWYDGWMGRRSDGNLWQHLFWKNLRTAVLIMETFWWLIIVMPVTTSISECILRPERPKDEVKRPEGPPTRSRAPEGR